jgi:hypothetical protein
MISPVRSVLEGFSGDFPTAADKWVRLRESRMKQERRDTERHGPNKDYLRYHKKTPLGGPSSGQPPSVPKTAPLTKGKGNG